MLTTYFLIRNGKSLSLLITILFICLCGHIFAQPLINNKTSNKNINSHLHIFKKDNYSSWKTAKQSQGVTIKYRKLTINNTIKTRELQACFYINSTPKTIIDNIKQPLKVKQWNCGVRDHKLLNNNDSIWITHTKQNIPRPFPQQDLITRYQLIERGNKTVVLLMNSLPDYIKPINGISRQRYFTGEWTFKREKDGKTLVKFSAISYDKSAIPRFIKDPIVQYTLIKSFSKLRNICENQE